jgi:hypothetical protein
MTSGLRSLLPTSVCIFENTTYNTLNDLLFLSASTYFNLIFFQKFNLYVKTICFLPPTHARTGFPLSSNYKVSRDTEPRKDNRTYGLFLLMEQPIWIYEGEEEGGRVVTLTGQQSCSIL